MNCELMCSVPNEDNKYLFTIYRDNDFSDYFYVQNCKAKVKDPTKYSQIILNGNSIKNILKWDMKDVLTLFCVSKCEVIAFFKEDNDIFIEIYRQFDDYRLFSKTKNEVYISLKTFEDMRHQIKEHI